MEDGQAHSSSPRQQAECLSNLTLADIIGDGVDVVVAGRSVHLDAVASNALSRDVVRDDNKLGMRNYLEAQFMARSTGYHTESTLGALSKLSRIQLTGMMADHISSYVKQKGNEAFLDEWGRRNDAIFTRFFDLYWDFRGQVLPALLREREGLNGNTDNALIAAFTEICDTVTQRRCNTTYSTYLSAPIAAANGP